MKITFLQHCGYFIELEDACLLFDYYRGELPAIPNGKKLYVFVSHSHYDHYNSDIFSLRDKADKVFYIISEDVITDNADDVYRVKARQKVSLDGCEIETIVSTDIGVAYIVRYAGKVIYHAGDMNWWAFPLQEAQRNEQVGTVYRTEIDALDNMHFDVAFVPLDPTLQEGFYLGLDYFMKHTETDMVFPMHFWGNFDVYKRLLALEESKSYADRVAEVNHYGQEWLID